MEYLALSYPSLAEVITIGHSYENQPIKMIKISTGPNKEGEAKPAVWIDAGELLFLYFLQKFSNYSTISQTNSTNYDHLIIVFIWRKIVKL